MQWHEGMNIWVHVYKYQEFILDIAYLDAPKTSNSIRETVAYMHQEILAGDMRNHGLNMVTDGENANEKWMGLGTEQRGHLIFIYVNRMLHKEGKNPSVFL